MIGSRFKRNVPYLHKLREARSNEERLRLLSRANPNQIFAIMDAANNILNKTYPLTSKQKTKLLPYRDYIRSIGRARTHTRAKKMHKPVEVHFCLHYWRQS